MNCLYNLSLEDVLKILGEYNSLLHRQSPPARTNIKLRFHLCSQATVLGGYADL